ncbi:hypothetical protein A0U91_14875 (plasmid) [Acetobacter persici]|uniref:Uncharacterized protein n=1 Tax=Acetobacter persici TaxID=1076596 RepID=A0A1U9LIL2_9PROT|nr:hypothetical protein A0U91_14875 [Acetobacter persici]
MAYYHLTPARNLDSIIRRGLLPSIGANSEAANEARAAIYLFSSIDALEDGLTNWLGDQFDEDERLALLKVTLPGGAATVSDAGYEVACLSPIPSAHIEILCENDLELDMDCLRQKEARPAMQDECAPAVT